MFKLTPVTQKFIVHWGEMGTRWGVNRTVAQIHALLYLSDEPLTAEEIAETLSVARSNVSNSLRELQNWGLVRTVHKLGDRRDHFESMKDVWEMFRVVMDERKRREIDPTIEVLRETIAELEKDRVTGEEQRAALSRMLEFFETAERLYAGVQKVPTAALVRFMKMGGRIQKLIRNASG